MLVWVGLHCVGVVEVGFGGVRLGWFVLVWVLLGCIGLR